MKEIQEILKTQVSKYGIPLISGTDDLCIFQGKIGEGDPLNIRVSYLKTSGWEKIQVEGRKGGWREEPEFYSTYQTYPAQLKCFPGVIERFIGAIYYQYQEYLTYHKEPEEDKKKIPESSPGSYCYGCEFFDGTNTCFHQDFWGLIREPCDLRYWKPKPL